MNVLRRASQTVSSVASAATGTVGSISRNFVFNGQLVNVNDCTEEDIVRSAKDKVTLQLKVGRQFLPYLKCS